MKIVSLLYVVCGLALAAVAEMVTCGGAYPQHLQGVTTDGDALYWSFTDRLVKTDGAGGVLKSVVVPEHHGDLCWWAGTLYVAVNRGVFNQPTGADSQVWAYDPETLAVRQTWNLPEVVHGAGGITVHDGSFWVVGGLPEGTTANTIYEYGPDFAFVRSHVLATGYTALGFQTIDYSFECFHIGVYGTATGGGGYTLVVPTTLDSFTRVETDTSVGVFKWKGRLWRAGLTGATGYVCADDPLTESIDIDWPADFDEQVAANHPRPRGAQIATNAVAMWVDARVAAQTNALVGLAVVEGRSAASDCSEPLSVDAGQPTGFLLFFR